MSSPTNRDIDVRPPHSGRLVREDNTFLNLADYLTGAGSMFGQLLVVERTPLIELKSSFGLSNLRDIQTTEGSATITNSAGEYNLATTASGTDSATLDSAERGQYIPGSAAETGIAVRLPQDMTGDQVARWGYFDDDDGMLFGQDGAGLFVRRRSGGTDAAKVRQADWNTDTVDGSGGAGNPSNLTLDLSDGHIFQVEFSWYGYGVIQYQIYMDGPNNRQQKITVHREVVDGSLSFENPNLPVRAELDNGGTATAADLFIGGRQYSIIGKERPNRRINGEYVQNSTIDTTFQPVISFRKKSAFENVTATLNELEAFASANMRYQVRLNGSLTDASFGGLTDTTASETALEVDTSATAISGGEILDKGFFSSSGGNKTAFTEASLLEQVIPSTQPVTVVARTITGSSETLDLTTTIKEQW